MTDAAETVAAALAGDYGACRSALARHIATLESNGNKLAAWPTAWTAAPDLALRIAQLWASHDGRNRASRRALMAALSATPGFVPPMPGPDAPAAGRLAHFEALLAPPSAELSLWSNWPDPSDPPEFRGEVSTSQAAAHEASNWGAAALLDAYRLQHLHARATDRLGLLHGMVEDGAFGTLRFAVDGHIVSRDTLDSAMELNFVASHAGLQRGDAFTWADIGAGWGRLVHRCLEGFPAARAMALDAVPYSSWTAEHYLHQRGVLGRAQVGGRALLGGARPLVASNVHSWSEAPIVSIRAWLDVLSASEVPWLFFVPHDRSAVSLEASGPGQPILPEIIGRGWQVVAERPKYGASPALGRHALYPFVHYFLLRR